MNLLDYYFYGYFESTALRYFLFEIRFKARVSNAYNVKKKIDIILVSK